MKKLLMVIILGSTIFTVGCQYEDKNIPAELQSVEESLPNVYKKLNIELDPYVKGQQVMVKVTILNEGEKEIPFHYENGGLLYLEILSPTGEKQTTIVASDLQSLNPGEEFVLEKQFDLPSSDGEYTVKAHLNLLDTQEFSYEEEQLDAVEVLQYQQQQPLSFLPGGEKTYVYENKIGDQVTQTEEVFLYFGDGFVQSNAEGIGTRIYYVDQKGLYLTYNKPEMRTTNLIGKVEYNKEQILSFPIAIGSVWETEGVQHEVISLNERLDIENKTYQDVVMVEADFGTGVRYFYHEEVGLLQVSVKSGEKWEVISKLIKIY